MIETELKTSNTIREMLTKNNKKLKGEIGTLAKVIKTSRNHFKELEKCDLDALTQQINKYESKIAELKISESKQHELRASKAKKRNNES